MSDQTEIMSDQTDSHDDVRDDNSAPSLDSLDVANFVSSGDEAPCEGVMEDIEALADAAERAERSGEAESASEEAPEAEAEEEAAEEPQARPATAQRPEEPPEPQAPEGEDPGEIPEDLELAPMPQQKHDTLTVGPILRTLMEALGQEESTISELQAKMDCERQYVHRLCVDLQELGLVENGRPFISESTGRAVIPRKLSHDGYKALGLIRRLAVLMGKN